MRDKLIGIIQKNNIIVQLFVKCLAFVGNHMFACLFRSNKSKIVLISVTLRLTVL